MKTTSSCLTLPTILCGDMQTKLTTTPAHNFVKGWLTDLLIKILNIFHFDVDCMMTTLSNWSSSSPTIEHILKQILPTLKMPDLLVCQINIPWNEQIHQIFQVMFLTYFLRTLPRSRSLTHRELHSNIKI